MLPSFLTKVTVSPFLIFPLVIRPTPSLPIYSSYPKLDICNCKLSFSDPAKGLHCLRIVSRSGSIVVPSSSREYLAIPSRAIP